MWSHLIYNKKKVTYEVCIHICIYTQINIMEFPQLYSIIVITKGGYLHKFSLFLKILKLHNQFFFFQNHPFQAFLVSKTYICIHKEFLYISVKSLGSWGGGGGKRGNNKKKKKKIKSAPKS